MRKGILFSSDALIALFIAFTLISAVFYSMNKISFPNYNNVEMYSLSSDFIDILKNNEELKISIENNNSTNIKKYFLILPQNICLDINITDKNNQEIIYLRKDNCPEQIFFDSSYYSEPFIELDNIYIASIKMWNR
jgi:hypothetical protein